MFNLKVPKLKLEKIKRLKVLGKYINWVVYLIKYDNKLLTLKIQKNYSDSLHFKFNNQFNDLIISYFISQNTIKILFKLFIFF